jgi:hypothetical protein
MQIGFLFPRSMPIATRRCICLQMLQGQPQGRPGYPALAASLTMSGGMSGPWALAWLCRRPRPGYALDLAHGPVKDSMLALSDSKSDSKSGAARGRLRSEAPAESSSVLRQRVEGGSPAGGEPDVGGESSGSGVDGRARRPDTPSGGSHSGVGASLPFSQGQVSLLGFWVRVQGARETLTSLALSMTLTSAHKEHRKRHPIRCELGFG